MINGFLNKENSNSIEFQAKGATALFSEQSFLMVFGHLFSKFNLSNNLF